MHILLTGSVLLVVLLALLVALLVALRFHQGQLQSIVNMYMCIRIFYTCHAFSTVASGIIIYIEKRSVKLLLGL